MSKLLFAGFDLILDSRVFWPQQLICTILAMLYSGPKAVAYATTRRIEGCSTTTKGRPVRPGSSIINQTGAQRLHYSVWIRDVFWLGPLGPRTKGARILYVQDTCPIMNQHHDGILYVQDTCPIRNQHHDGILYVQDTCPIRNQHHDRETLLSNPWVASF